MDFSRARIAREYASLRGTQSDRRPLSHDDPSHDRRIRCHARSGDRGSASFHPVVQIKPWTVVRSGLNTWRRGETISRSDTSSRETCRQQPSQAVYVVDTLLFSLVSGITLFGSTLALKLCRKNEGGGTQSHGPIQYGRVTGKVAPGEIEG